MQVGEQQVVGAQQRAFGGERLLDLDDHFGAGEEFPRAGDDRRAGGAVVVVGRADAEPGRLLDQHSVAVFAHPRTEAGVSPTRYSWFLISLGFRPA